MSKVLILGAKGMLGQELVQIFKSDKKYEVVAWDKEEVDIIDEKRLREKIFKLKPVIILNAVAYNAVDKCEENKKEFKIAQAVNGKAPGYLAKIAKELGAILVHYSTDYVFGKEMPRVVEPIGCTGHCATCELHKEETLEIGFDEKAKPAPVNKYGETKLMGEKEVQTKGEKYYIIRLSKLFGQPATSPEAKKSFFEVMLELGQENKEVKVVDSEISCFTYAPDLAEATKKIIESQEPWGIYHVVNSGSCTWFEAVEELYLQVGLETKIIPIDSDYFNRPAKRPYLSTLLNTKLEPLRDYREALVDYLKKINLT